MRRGKRKKGEEKEKEKEKEKEEGILAQTGVFFSARGSLTLFFLTVE
jgi:hypothetical protein